MKTKYGPSSNLFGYLGVLISYIERKIKSHCRLVYGVLLDDTNPYPKCKRVIGFIYGLLLGIIFYEVFLIDLEFPTGTLLILGGLVIILLAFGSALSRFDALLY